MDSLQSLIECAICMSEYDSNFHYPLVMKCGHDICSASLRKLYNNNCVRCPFCKADNNYPNIDSISKNFSLMKIIDSMKKSPVFQFKCRKNKDMLKPVDDLIGQIKDENKKIEKFFDELTQRKVDLIVFNNYLLKHLELFTAKVKVQQKQAIKSHFEKIEIEYLGGFKSKENCDVLL